MLWIFFEMGSSTNVDIKRGNYVDSKFCLILLLEKRQVL